MWTAAVRFTFERAIGEHAGLAEAYIIMTFKGRAVLATIALVGLIGGLLMVARGGGSTDGQGRIAAPAGDERSLVERRDSLQPLESSLPAPGRRTGSVTPTSITKASSTNTAEPQSLPVETHLLTHEALDLSRYDVIQSDDGFAAALERLAQESMDSPEATELTLAYESSIQLFLEHGEDVDYQLTELECGLRVCLGALSGADFHGWEQMLERVAETSPYYAFAEHDVALPDGQIERRVLFTTDPSYGGVTIPFTAPGG